LTSNSAAPDRLPVPALLSRALVAYTIEFDNAFEARMPHRTTRYGAPGGRDAPWLVSLAMWASCMRYVDERGIPPKQLTAQAQMRTNLPGMVRWGYVRKDGELLRATRAGMLARSIWEPLAAEIDERWNRRFGFSATALRAALAGAAEHIDVALPDAMPILGYGLKSTPAARGQRDRSEDTTALPLVTLLSRILLALTLDYERSEGLSLGIAANVLRLIPGDGIAVRELPARSGVSKEAIAMAVGFLERERYVRHDGRMLSRTELGDGARERYERYAWKLNDGAVRTSLEALEPHLLQGLATPPGGWREKRATSVLPHQPMVLHRGGFPDGS
jgi:hypothetical protein